MLGKLIGTVLKTKAAKSVAIGASGPTALKK